MVGYKKFSISLPLDLFAAMEKDRAWGGRSWYIRQLIKAKLGKKNRPTSQKSKPPRVPS